MSVDFNTVKPCPFCGGKAVLKVSDKCDWYYMKCSVCNAQTDGNKSEFIALAKWNRRTDND